MFEPVPFRDRSRRGQIVLAGVLPAGIGAGAGVLIGVSAPAYWAIGLLAAGGSLIAGFEHRDGWGGADRGLVSGAIYGIALLLVHAWAGTRAKVSLGSFPALLAVLTALIGAVLGAVGGRIARWRRERAGAARGEPAQRVQASG
jgi:apolipoprotein N-acyltransferase